MIEKYKKYQQLLKTDIKNAEFIGKFEIGKLSDGLYPSKSQHETIANIVFTFYRGYFKITFI
jgi:hypothetical protein